MNVPFQSLPPETQMQIIIAYVDMALVTVGRFLQVAVPLVLIAMIAFLFPSLRKRRRRPR